MSHQTDTPAADASAPDPEPELTRDQLVGMTLGEYMAHMSRNERMVTANHLTNAIRAILDGAPPRDWPHLLTEALTRIAHAAGMDRDDVERIGVDLIHAAAHLTPTSDTV